jgi:hypothetical protein
VLAVKGLGGYHLAADAADEAAVGALRSRKQRELRPFAVMVRDVPAARGLGEVGADEERLLTGPTRPIVRPDDVSRADKAVAATLNTKIDTQSGQNDRATHRAACLPWFSPPCRHSRSMPIMSVEKITDRSWEHPGATA